MSKRKPLFYRVLEEKLARKNLTTEDICDNSDAVETRILNEYGAIFLAHESVVAPPKAMFADAEEVENFQKEAGFASEYIEGILIQLQPNALEKLLAACAEARTKNLKISPRGGPEAAKRNFEDTSRLWESRFTPACKYWKNRRKLTVEQIKKLKSLPMKEQVKNVLELEEKEKIYFNTFFNRSILYSVAAPGTSQHLSMLAFDAVEFADKKIRKIFAKHGWFRTVQNDAPHFTYLGYAQKDLKKLGLKKIETEDGEFWIPNV